MLPGFILFMIVEMVRLVIGFVLVGAKKEKNVANAETLKEEKIDLKEKIILANHHTQTNKKP